MNITIIASGSTKIERLMNKWGLSILINDDVLFDTFCNEDFLKANFKKFNIDIQHIKHIVLSHEHWDHTGGLWWLLEQNNNVKVYICNGFSGRFKSKVKNSGATLVEVTDMIPIKENIVTTGEIQGIYNARPIVEQSLIIKEKNKLAIITGCSHPGILTILSRVKEQLDDDIDLLLGGLHLINAQEAEIAGIAAMVDDQYNIKTVAPFHCTGDQALHYFKKKIPYRFKNVTEGNSFYFNPEKTSWELRQGMNR